MADIQLRAQLSGHTAAHVRQLARDSGVDDKGKKMVVVDRLVTALLPDVRVVRAQVDVRLIGRAPRAVGGQVGGQGGQAAVQRGRGGGVLGVATVLVVLSLLAFFLLTLYRDSEAGSVDIELSDDSGSEINDGVVVSLALDFPLLYQDEEDSGSGAGRGRRDILDGTPVVDLTPSEAATTGGSRSLPGTVNCWSYGYIY